MSLLSRIWRFGGLTLMLLAALSLAGGYIWLHGEKLGLDTLGKKLLGFLFVCVIGVAVRFGSALIQLVKQKKHRKEEKQKDILPDDETRLAKTAPRHVTVAALRQALRQTYGRFWPRKVRILLLTGSAADVEQLAPNLT